MSKPWAPRGSGGRASPGGSAPDAPAFPAWVSPEGQALSFFPSSGKRQVPGGWAGGRGSSGRDEECSWQDTQAVTRDWVAVASLPPGVGPQAPPLPAVPGSWNLRTTQHTP